MKLTVCDAIVYDATKHYLKVSNVVIGVQKIILAPRIGKLPFCVCVVRVTRVASEVSTVFAVVVVGAISVDSVVLTRSVSVVSSVSVQLVLSVHL